jgi:hypothetical protein
MNSLTVNYSKGQMKIQQMAFVLVALMIFFAIALLIFFMIRYSSLKEGVQDLREDDAREIVRKISAMPEFSFNQEDCSSCIDADKVLVLKNRTSYKDFWNIGYLQIEKIYPEAEGECNRFNYPNCKTVTVISGENFGTASSAFVSLCRWEEREYFKCELGRVYAAWEGFDDN